MRGRIVAIYQSLMKIILAVCDGRSRRCWSRCVQPRNVIVFGHPMEVDGTRPVLLGAGLIAARASA